MARWFCRLCLRKPKPTSEPCRECCGWKRPPVLPRPGKAGA